MTKAILAIMSVIMILMACNLAKSDAVSATTLMITQVPDDLLVTSPVHPTVFQGNDLYEQARDPVRGHVRDIYERGIAFGNRAGVFSKVGDSLTVSPNFLTMIGMGRYDLVGYTHLEGVIQQYSQVNARNSNSFSNPSLAAGVGWTSYTVLNPDDADELLCREDESPLICEYRLVRPTVAIILFGTNDVGFRHSESFRNSMMQIVTLSELVGVIPILSTIPPRPDAADQVIRFNAIIREIAETEHLPLIDYYDAMIDLPHYGLTTDEIHPSIPPRGVSGSAIFTDNNLYYGYVVRNLLTLEALDIVQGYIDPS